MNIRLTLVLSAAVAVMLAASFALAANPNKRPLAPVPTTGQVDCYEYDAGMQVWSVTSCVGVIGQDGTVQAGVDWPAPRFVPMVSRKKDNGDGGGIKRNGICDGSEHCDGTVLDRLTGLVWLRDAFCQELPNPTTWSSALSAADGLHAGDCGLDDGSQPGQWHVPNIRELQSLIDFGQSAPALPLDHPFVGIPSVFGEDTNYWSSTTAATESTQGLGFVFAWNIDLTVGVVRQDAKDLLGAPGRRTWAVRDYARK